MQEHLVERPLGVVIIKPIWRPSQQRRAAEHTYLRRDRVVLQTSAQPSAELRLEGVEFLTR